MGVVNQLSTNAAPLLHPQSAEVVTGRNIEQISRIVTLTNGDSIGSTYLLGILPDTAVVERIVFEGPASTLTGANDSDIGLYDMNGVVKVVDCYSEALDLTGAGTAGGPHGGVTYQGAANVAPAGVFTAGVIAAGQLQQVWQDAGDVEGPFPASGSTLKAAKYQVGMILNAAVTHTTSFLVTIVYRKTP